MKWKIEKETIVNENDNVVAGFTGNATEEERRIAVNAPLAFAAIEEFIDDVNSGSLKPRKAAIKFEKILNKVKD